MQQKRTPLISVVIPAFNAEACIERAVLSVLEQSYSPVEVIVVDDGSEDGTGAILKVLADRNSQLTVVKHEKNRGVSASRNAGILLAKGDWISFLDADDYFRTDYISQISPYLSQRDLLLTSYVQVDGNGGEIVKRHAMKGTMEVTNQDLLAYMEEYFFKPYAFTALMHCWNKFFRSDILMSNKVVFDERLSQLEDVNFVCNYLRCSENRIYVDAPGLCHTVNDSSGNLSSQSGTGKEACEKLVTALSAADGLKKHLLDHCHRDEVVSFKHFICSMSVLFCMRIGRQFWRSPAWSSCTQIYRWLSFGFIRECARAFRHVPGESRLLAFSLRRFPPLMSTVILLCLRR